MQEFDVSKPFESLLFLEKELGKLHASLKWPDGDVRVVTVGNLRGFVGSAITGLVTLRRFNQFDVRDPFHVVKTLCGHSLDSVVYCFDKAVRTGFTAQYLFQSEHLFGQLRTALGCSGTASIKAKSKDLAQRLSLSGGQTPEALLVSIYLRNTFHNNGIQVGDDYSATLDGVTYALKKGQPVECASWAHLAHASRAWLPFLAAVLNHVDVQKLPFIEDPFFAKYGLSEQQERARLLNNPPDTKDPT